MSYKEDLKVYIGYSSK